MTTDDELLNRITKELVEHHGAHTVILYGSRSVGRGRTDSDYDVAAIAPRSSTLRVAHPVGEAFLDGFVYPEAVLLEPGEEHLKMLRGRAIVDTRPEAEDFLNRLRVLHRRGPKPLLADEMQMRKVWVVKMLARAARQDPEGNCRRVWLLTALLEDYFVIEGMWYEGPKRALQWLSDNQPALYEAYVAALHPGASQEAVAILVGQAYGVDPLAS